MARESLLAGPGVRDTQPRLTPNDSSPAWPRVGSTSRSKSSWSAAAQGEEKAMAARRDTTRSRVPCPHQALGPSQLTPGPKPPRISPASSASPAPSTTPGRRPQPKPKQQPLSAPQEPCSRPRPRRSSPLPAAGTRAPVREAHLEPARGHLLPQLTLPPPARVTQDSTPVGMLPVSGARPPGTRLLSRFATPSTAAHRMGLSVRSHGLAL